MRHLVKLGDRDKAEYDFLITNPDNVKVNKPDIGAKIGVIGNKQILMACFEAVPPRYTVWRMFSLKFRKTMRDKKKLKECRHILQRYTQQNQRFQI